MLGSWFGSGAGLELVDSLDDDDGESAARVTHNGLQSSSRALKNSTQATRERTGIGFPALAAAGDGEGRDTHHRNPADHDSRCAGGCV